MPEATSETVVLDHDDLQRTLVRIAHEIIEKNPPGSDDGDIAIVGIHTRGAILGDRLHALVCELSEAEGAEIPLGDLDISFYRDDIDERDRRTSRSSTPRTSTSTSRAGPSILVDDVLFTGRTVRAAIDALFDYGRPRRVQLAVLADRGHRELPIRPDYVGKNLPTSAQQRVNVRLAETDGIDEVTIGPARIAAAANGGAPE